MTKGKQAVSTMIPTLIIPCNTLKLCSNVPDFCPSTYVSLGSARFMKTIRGRQRDGTVVVKIFVKPESGYSLKRIARKLNGRPHLHKGAN